MTPSGVPPMPKRMSAPDSGQAAEMAPATSPSGMSRMRAPASRHSLMMPACRSRSRMTAVTSSTSLRSAFDTHFRLALTEAVRSMASAASGPVAIFSM